MRRTLQDIWVEALVHTCLELAKAERVEAPQCSLSTGCLCSDDPDRFGNIAMASFFLGVIPQMIPMLVVEHRLEFGRALRVFLVQAVTAAVFGVCPRVSHHPAQSNETRWACRHPESLPLLQPLVRVSETQN